MWTAQVVDSPSTVVDELGQVLWDLFNIYDVTVVDNRPTVKFRGRLTVPSEQAYDEVARRLQPRGFVPFFRREGPDHVILIMRGSLPTTRPRVGLALGLFVATVVSVILAGAQGGVNSSFWQNLQTGVLYAATLLTILVAHEMGHYLVSRYYNTPVSLPYFIPMPIFLFGTMGAFIRMVAPPKNRRQWLHIAAAGPLAGLVFAIPLTLLGLALSDVEPLPPQYIMEGNSLLYLWLKFLVFGKVLPSGGEDVFLHTIAWAGWGGLLVTALNLIPAAQLDGGHVARALLGSKAQLLTYGIVGALLLMSFLWGGWALWAVIIFLLSRAQVMPLDDITEPTSGDKLLAAFMLLLFVLLFIPVPLRVVL